MRLGCSGHPEEATQPELAASPAEKGMAKPQEQPAPPGERCFFGAGPAGCLPCLLKHFQLNPVEFNLLLLINFPVSLPTPLRTPRRYYSEHNRKGLFFSANFLTEEASVIPP